MRFLVDESTGPSVARWLRERGHDVFSVYEECRGASDPELLARAVREARILITNDKDFGDLIYRDRRPHRGILLLRLDDDRTPVKLRVVEQVLEHYADQLAERFTVATEERVRIAGPPPSA